MGDVRKYCDGPLERYEAARGVEVEGRRRGCDRRKGGGGIRKVREGRIDVWKVRWKTRRLGKSVRKED